MAAARGPDFLCVGQMKAGTGWLYDQLDSHPQMRMPPVKELRYFNVRLHTKALAALSHKAAEDLDGVNRKRLNKGQRPLERRDLQFLHRACALRDAAGERFQRRAEAVAAGHDARGFDWQTLAGDDPGDLDGYAELFPERVSGDITPSYAMLPQGMIDTIAARFPDLKIVFLVRDPVARAASELGMLDRKGRADADELAASGALERWLNHFEWRTAPTVWRRWSQAFPQSRFWFFDDLRERPDWLRREIAAFLGVARQGFTRPADFNPSPGGASASPGLLAPIARRLEGELDACADIFGGPATTWKQKYRELL